MEKNKSNGGLYFDIVPYLSFLKTEESIDRNVAKAINFLLGKERFVGRDGIGA